MPANGTPGRGGAALGKAWIGGLIGCHAGPLFGGRRRVGGKEGMLHPELGKGGSVDEGLGTGEDGEGGPSRGNSPQRDGKKVTFVGGVSFSGKNNWPME